MVERPQVRDSVLLDVRVAVQVTSGMAPTASGSDSSMAVFVRPHRPYGRGTGNATTLGCPSRSAR